MEITKCTSPVAVGCQEVIIKSTSVSSHPVGLLLWQPANTTPE